MSTRAKKCPLCGEVNGVLAKNCFMCDTALPDTRTGLDDTPADDWFRQQIAQGTAQPTLTSASASVQPSQPRPRHCTDCGESINGTVNFCPSCGTSVYDPGDTKTSPASVALPQANSPAPQVVGATQPTTDPASGPSTTGKSSFLAFGVLFFLFVVLPISCINASKNVTMPGTLQRTEESTSKHTEDSAPRVRFDPAPVRQPASAPEPPVVSIPQPVSRLYTVEYEVIAQGKCSITYTNAQGSIEQITDAKDDWSRKFTARSGQFLSVSAQNGEDYGVMFVTIYVDGNEVRESESSGGYSIASADFMLP